MQAQRTGCHPTPNEQGHPKPTLSFQTSTVTRTQWRDLSTVAETQTLNSRLRRFFDCAQDDRLGCHLESLLCCHPDRSGGISRQWQRLRLQALCSGDPSAALRMTGLGATPSCYYAVIPTAVEGSQPVGRRSFGSLRSLRMIGFADDLQGLFSVEFHPVKIKVILVCFFYEWYYLRNKKTNNHISATHTAPPNTLRERAL